MSNLERTEWIVVRPEGGIAGGRLAPGYEGQWLRRDQLGAVDVLELGGPQGPVRAYPTEEIELSPAGDIAQVWRVRGDTGADAREHGLDSPDHGPPS
ncbi:hypothetical protein SAMN05443575_2263 [Jatrophihabitans endophyticus]|uniref:Uncharacterized protein n=1 Tax=Jatrophihabitans endophyticus TaxID=1206085 RepID=A0A1M5KUH4_9ACTN|nr:hypothetical protein [Jatrophihabitans endophyticus]SHG56386.1 hypothetical protein SAMN05443575_2263 [Jatrophihabitans endophyticus]